METRIRGQESLQSIDSEVGFQIYAAIWSCTGIHRPKTGKEISDRARQNLEDLGPIRIWQSVDSWSAKQDV